MKHTRLNSCLWISFPFTSNSILGFTDKVARTNRFFKWWSVSIERYLLFTKFMMETEFSHMYVDPNLQQYRRAISHRAGNRDGRKYIQEMVNSWLSTFTYSDFVCSTERAYACHQWHACRGLATTELIRRISIMYPKKTSSDIKQMLYLTELM